LHNKHCSLWLVLVVALALLGVSGSSAAGNGDWPPLELQLTGQTASDGVTTIYLNLHNKQNIELSEITVIGTVPTGASFVNAELISAANPGVFNGSGVTFQIEHLRGGASLGPLVYRFKADSPADSSYVHAWATWNRPTPGTAISTKLSVALLGFLGPGETDESWETLLTPLVQSAEEQGSRVGLLIYDTGSGQRYTYHPEDLFILASNTKLLTAATALDVLGPDYQFRTVVGYAGTLAEDGTLAGDLVIKGYGDPTLTTRALAGWVDVLFAAGIRQVTGDILVDGSAFEDEASTLVWGWDTDAASFQPRTGALSVNHNEITLTAIPGDQAGAPSWVRVEPAIDRQVVHNNVATGAAGQPAVITLHADESGIVSVAGQVPAGGAPAMVEITAQDPALYTGFLFSKLLREKGIVFANDSTVAHSRLPDDAQILVEHASAPFGAVLDRMLKDSDNFVAEQVLRVTGLAAVHSGSNQGGQAAISQFLTANGFSAMPYMLCDGCGLRLDNEASPRLIVGLLVLMAHHPHGDIFRDALAVAGEDGTLARRMAGIPSSSEVHAKTGSLLGASTLSGYGTTVDGRELAFAILMNDEHEGGWLWVRAMREIQDKMVVALLQQKGTTPK